MARKQLIHKGFAKFFFCFQNFDFYDTTKKRKLPKYILWAAHRAECERMAYKGEASGRFKLIHRNRA